MLVGGITYQHFFRRSQCMWERKPIKSLSLEVKKKKKTKIFFLHNCILAIKKNHETIKELSL